jgi:hypothetical protein
MCSKPARFAFSEAFSPAADGPTAADGNRRVARTLRAAEAGALVMVPVMVMAVPVVVVMVPVPPVVVSFGRGAGGRACRRGNGSSAGLLAGRFRQKLVLQHILRARREIKFSPGELQFEALGEVALAGVGLGAAQFDAGEPASCGARYREVRFRRAAAGFDGYGDAGRSRFAGDDPFKFLIRRRDTARGEHQCGHKRGWLQKTTHDSCPKLKAAHVSGRACPSRKPRNHKAVACGPAKQFLLDKCSFFVNGGVYVAGEAARAGP